MPTTTNPPATVQIGRCQHCGNWGQVFTASHHIGGGRYQPRTWCVSLDECDQRATAKAS